MWQFLPSSSACGVGSHSYPKLGEAVIPVMPLGAALSTCSKRNFEALLFLL